MSIYLIGDAILDNFFWLTNKSQDLKYELTQFKYNVHNYAADGTTVKGVLTQTTPDKNLVKFRSYPYHLKEGKLHQIQELANKFNKNYGFKCIHNSLDSKAMIVLSIGGNDMKHKSETLFLNMDNFINSILTKEFVNNYEQIITFSQSCTNKVVLIANYTPFIGRTAKMATYAAYAKDVIEKWNRYLDSLAKKFNIPLLDLNRTLDCLDRSHYGDLEIHCSNKSSKCIAECLDYIYRHYDGYHVYYKSKCEGEIIVL
jgi:hypothetical protein